MTSDEMLTEAADLLDAARCAMFDPALRRAWGQRRRRLLDAIAGRPAGHVIPDEMGGKTGNRHPSTSRRAATGVRRGTQHSALLAVVAVNRHDGVTCYEAADPVARMLGRPISRNQVATRMGELAERGLVCRRVDHVHGGYVERATLTDTACVWFPTPAGLAERERLRGTADA